MFVIVFRVSDKASTKRKNRVKDLVVVLEGDWELVTGYWLSGLDRTVRNRGEYQKEEE